MCHYLGFAMLMCSQGWGIALGTSLVGLGAGLHAEVGQEAFDGCSQPLE